MRLFGISPQKAAFRNRPNRFVVECDLKGQVVTAYLPNPGRLWEILLPGRTLYVSKNTEGAKIPYLVMAAERDGVPILLHTHLTNTIVEGLLRERKVPGLEDMAVIRREAAFGKSRFDFLLGRDKGSFALEVKTCTLFNNTLAMFPDAVTARGSKHLLELSGLTSRGFDSGVLFVIQWPFVTHFMPEYHTDLEFSRNLLKVRDEVLIKAVALQWDRDFSVPSGVRELVIPWELIERECHDGGSYIIILYLQRTARLRIGELGNISFRKGYYLYVGSARRDLTKRILRHQRRRKNLFWHIDYFTQAASFYKAIPLRTAADLECDLAGRLEDLADWSIPKFGSSDCPCQSHLFGMEGNPLTSARFIEMLLYYRMGRIEEELSARQGPTPGMT